MIYYIEIGTNPGYFGERSYSLKEDTSDYILLKPGKYVLRVKAFWKNKDTGDFTLVCNSQRQVSIAKANRADYKNFLSLHMLPIARQDKDTTDLGNDSLSTNAWHATYCYAYFKNGGAGTLNLNLECTKLTNMIIPKRFSTNGRTFSITVTASGEEIVFFKKKDRTGGGSYEWEWTTQYLEN